jgi:hypothetical protein
MPVGVGSSTTPLAGFGAIPVWSGARSSSKWASGRNPSGHPLPQAISRTATVSPAVSRTEPSSRKAPLAEVALAMQPAISIDATRNPFPWRGSQIMPRLRA